MVALEYGGLADSHYLGLTPHLDFTGACVVQQEVVEMQAQLRRWRVRILSHAAACKSVVCFASRNNTTVRFSVVVQVVLIISRSSGPM